MSVNIEELSSKNICNECVGDSYLSQEISSKGRKAKCSFCESTHKCISLNLLADKVEKAFEDHYVRTSDQPTSWQYSLLADRESLYEWDREGFPIAEAIEDAANIPSQAANDIQAILADRHHDEEAARMGEENEFSENSYYIETESTDSEWFHDWLRFEQSLKTEARFFSQVAAYHLNAVFSRIDQIKTSGGRPLIVKAGGDTKLNNIFRARVFQSSEKLKEALKRPDIHLGPPPMSYANAGRMNARGISVFYGATTDRTAIAEVRPPVGSNVAVANFRIIRELNLLDLTALESVKDFGSVFDPTLKQRLERVEFLKTLGYRMTRPVMPDDEAFDYLATQAIADFLATENNPLLDGIIFKSAQVKEGRNIVLFHKAARVEDLDLPEGTEIEIQSSLETEDGIEVDYSVTEWVPKSNSENELNVPDIQIPWLNSEYQDEILDSRKVTLRIETQSISVHAVNWIAHHCTKYGVSRRRDIAYKDSDF